MIEVKLPNGESYTVKSLLANGDSNTKMAKSNEASVDFLTFGLSLSPAKESGYEMCASRSAGCTKACLYTAGMGVYQNVKDARVAKTIAFMEHRTTFYNMLYKELQSARRKATKQGKKAAVRLNVVSDVQWEKVFPDLFVQFHDVQFYDYTKHYKRMIGYCYGELPKNYHLTFSRSEANEKQCWTVLMSGGNVTVVFNKKEFPENYLGFPVVNGDETDLRFLDPRKSVVGLYAKGQGKKDKTNFVVSLPTI